MIGERELNSSTNWTWQFANAVESALAPMLARWSELEAIPGAKILKQNLLRTVIAVPATDRLPALIVKRYRSRDLWEQCKYWFLPSRAAREWEALRHLAASGVTGPRALAMGECRASGRLVGAGLIMEQITDGDPAPRWLELRSVPPDDAKATSLRADRRAVLAALGREVARLHAAGVDHTDLHAGNLLVAAPAPSGTGPRIWILDLHATYIGVALPAARRLANLARLSHSLIGSTDLSERLAMVAAYLSEPSVGNTLGEAAHVLDLLESRAERIESIRLASRSKRCWQNSSDFHHLRRGSLRIWHRREVPQAALISFSEETPSFTKIFKQRADTVVGVTQLDVGARVLDIVVKTRRLTSLLARLAYRFYPGPLERAWGAARALEVRGIPTPRALALLVQRRWGLPVRAVLVTELVSNAKPLHTQLWEEYRAPRTRSRRALYAQIRAIAEMVRRLHDTGIYHRDLNPMNLLVARESAAAAWTAQLVDLDSIHLGRRLTQRRRQKNLVQLGLLPEGHITVRDKLRFLRDYDRGEGRYWNRTWIAELARQLGEETVRLIEKLCREEQHAAARAQAAARSQASPERGV
ncbi:MAG: lipopolysaccharide kinase InaA family protein [Planctomycetota bacterium]